MNDKHPLPNEIAFARELRKNLTPAEKIIWDMLRNRQVLGLKFLRQHPIIVNKSNGKRSFYIADFYCAGKKFVLEIDGLIHSFQVDYDEARDLEMYELGIKVLRITNAEIEKNPYEVLNRIKMFLTHP